MYYVYFWQAGELHSECCGNSCKSDGGWGNTSAGWAWRLVMAHADHAWMEYVKEPRKEPRV